jgi:Protein of unknown function (DUF4236)
MGYFRFYRRKKIGPGLSLNMSKSGPSLSIGPRGAKVTIGRRGVRKTVGLPGTGLYYTSTSRSVRTTRKASDSAGLGYLVLFVIAAALVVAFWQYIVLIAVGATGIGLMVWAWRRGRKDEEPSPERSAMLAELADLHRAGVLSDAEFETKRLAILGSAAVPSSDPSVSSAGPPD